MGHEIDVRTPERAALEQRWAARHGAATARRLADAEDFADTLDDALVPANTTDTYTKGWRVWQRFCATQNFPVTEGSRGALVAYAAWLLREGRQTPGPGGATGYAPASAGSHLTAAVVGLRERGHEVTKDAASAARTTLERMTVQLLKAGERRGRGKAPAADIDGLRTIAAACDTTLTGRRDLALVLLSFHFAGRASEPAGLLAGDVTEHPKGIRVDVLTGKTRHSVRNPAIPYATDPAACPVRAWKAWRAALRTARPDLDTPTDPAFHTIDRWGNVGGPMSPGAVTEAVARIAARSGIPLRWTGHSLRSGLATEARRNGRDAVAIAGQGGWAPNSRPMLGYMRTVDDWDDNASAGLS